MQRQKAAWQSAPRDQGGGGDGGGDGDRDGGRGGGTESVLQEGDALDVDDGGSRTTT